MIANKWGFACGEPCNGRFLMAADHVRIFDTTLRDGEQTPGPSDNGCLGDRRIDIQSLHVDISEEYNTCM